MKEDLTGEKEGEGALEGKGDEGGPYREERDQSGPFEYFAYFENTL